MAVQDEKKILVTNTNLVAGVKKTDEGELHGNKKGEIGFVAAVKGSNHLAAVVSEILRPHVNSDKKNVDNLKTSVVSEKMLTKIKEGEIRATEFAEKKDNKVAVQGNAIPAGSSAKTLESFFGKLNNPGKGVKINKPMMEKVRNVPVVIDDVVSGKEVLPDRAKVSIGGHKLNPDFTVNEKLNINSDVQTSVRNKKLERNSSKNKVEDSLSESDLNVSKLVAGDESKNEGQNVDRNIKAEQRIAHVQNGKNEMFGQNQKRNEFVYQSNSLKSKEGKSDVVDVGSIPANEKKFMMGKVQAAKMPVSVQNSANPDLKAQFGDMVVRGAKQFINGGSQEIHLTIRKPDLGNLKISFVERGKGGLDVSIVAERADAVEVIKQSSSELKQLLLQDGIDLSKFDVSSENGRDRGRLAHNDGYQRKHQGRQNVEDDTLSNLYDKDVERYTQELENRGVVTGTSQINVFV